jgi:hypothetical protein
MKKIIKHLMLWDVIWAPLLGFAGFVAVGMGIQMLYATEEGSAASSYDPAFFQAAVYAAGVMVLFSGAALAGMWVNARGLWKYLFRGLWKPDFRQLTPLQRMLVALSPYWIYIATMIIIWSKLV